MFVVCCALHVPSPLAPPWNRESNRQFEKGFPAGQGGTTQKALTVTLCDAASFNSKKLGRPTRSPCRPTWPSTRHTLRATLGAVPATS